MLFVCFDSFLFSPNIITIIVIIVNLMCLYVANSVITIINGSKCSYGNFYHAVCIPHQVSPYYIDHTTMYVCMYVRIYVVPCCGTYCVASSSELHMTYAVFCSCLMIAQVICSVVNGFRLLSASQGELV